MRTGDERELLRRARAGDEQALAVLLERYRPLLLHRAERRLPPGLRHRVSVADVVQEAQIVAHERHGELEDRGPEAYRAWLLKILDFKVKEAVRTHRGTAKRAVDREVAPKTSVRDHYFVSRRPSPSQVAMRGELAEMARRAMEALPPDYQQVLRLAQEQGLTLREVAACMGRSREAIKRLYARALSRFALELKAKGARLHG